MKTKPDEDFSFNTTPELLSQVLRRDFFTPNDKGVAPIPFHRVDGETPLVLVLGDNAAGKSFFRRVVQAVSSKNKVECIHLSMEARRTISYNPWLAMVYGDEEHESTGVNSASMVKSGVSTCRSRTTSHVIFWDEPDIGLSDCYAAGVGVALREFAQTVANHTKAAFVVTHSKPLVEQVLSINPTYIHLGTEDAPRTLQDWLKKPVQPRPIEELLEATRVRFKLIQEVLKDR